METSKYQDMAYRNSLGKKWLETLKRPDIWNKWETKVRNRGKRPQDETYAHRILVEAIWIFGYTKKPTAFAAYRLRRPGEGGFKKRFNKGTADFLSSRNLWEFQELDDFLERYVRPIM